MPGRGRSHNPNVLTPRMLAVLRKIATRGGIVDPIGGGYWACLDGTRLGWPNMTQTIVSLERRLLLERRDGGKVPSHKAPRYLTDAGRTKIASMEGD